MAAAAGAGYLAKYWQNISRDREGSSGFPSRSPFHDDPESSSLIQKTRDNTCPISKLSPIETSEHYFTETGNGNHSERIFAEESRDGKHEEGNMPFSSIFPPEYRKYETIEEYRSEMGASHGSRRSKNVLRTKRLHLQFIKPRSSLDSCLMAQMHKEHAEMEEYLRSPLVSPCTPTSRPFIVTDGRKVISRASVGLRDGPHKEVLQKAHDTVVGLPALPQIGIANHSKEKLDKVKSQMAKSNNAGTSMHFDSQGGSSSGQVLFCLGISIGIMSTAIANKLEVRKLEESLKQSENLVQDLQEELEMKDSLTVKELYDDDSQDAHENLCGDKKLNMFSSQVNNNIVVKCADDESITLKEVESMSKIEAELEAELERLERSMKGSTLQGRLSDAIELDQELDVDMMAELVHGELKANIIQRQSSSEPTLDQVSSTTSTPLSAKHGVSPRELSVRLHEVIQSRLQEQVIQLEAELAKSQKRVRELESERINSWREGSNSESSSTLGSPSARSPMAQPLIMNLSGDALDAYNEAYDELNKLKGSPNKTCLSTTGEPLPNGRKKIPSNEGSPNIYEDKDDDNDDDDLLLIKQIVEKARQGSPAILRAQRAMVYLNKDDRW